MIFGGAISWEVNYRGEHFRTSLKALQRMNLQTHCSACAFNCARLDRYTRMDCFLYTRMLTHYMLGHLQSCNRILMAGIARIHVHYGMLTA